MTLSPRAAPVSKSKVAIVRTLVARMRVKSSSEELPGLVTRVAAAPEVTSLCTEELPVDFVTETVRTPTGVEVTVPRRVLKGLLERPSLAGTSPLGRPGS